VRSRLEVQVFHLAGIRKFRCVAIHWSAVRCKMNLGRGTAPAAERLPTSTGIVSVTNPHRCHSARVCGFVLGLDRRANDMSELRIGVREAEPTEGIILLKRELSVTGFEKYPCDKLPGLVPLPSSHKHPGLIVSSTCMRTSSPVFHP